MGALPDDHGGSVGRNGRGGDGRTLGGTGGGATGSPPTVPSLPPLAEPPEEFIDPISQELMLDPVLLVETGQSYERSTIEAWFERCRAEPNRPCTDPLTRQELRSTTVVPNYSLKSLVASWAERQRIPDLPSFSKQVARQRSQAQSPAATAADAMAALQLGGSSNPAGRASGGSDPGGGAGYPALEPMYPASRQQTQPGMQQQQQQQQQQQLGDPAAPAHPSFPRTGLYPETQQPLGVGKQQQADEALSALRAAATQGSGASRGAAPYNAWTLQQLAGDAEGRKLLWEGNGVPLAIFLLGQLQKQPEDAALSAAAPALCAMLQRMGARDAEVAASISQCGGVHALVCQLTAPDPALRAAACRALYFLGWHGRAIRSEILGTLSQHAAASNLPARPLLAFWRFWEQQQAVASQGASGGSTTSNGSAPLPAGAGREAEWECLALLLHMLAEGCSTAARSSADGAEAAAALEPMDAASTGVPSVLAYAAAASKDPAVRFAAHEAVALLSQLRQNRALLLSALLQQGQQAGSRGSSGGDSSGDGSRGGSGGDSSGGGSSGGSGGDSSAAGNVAWLLWELCFRADRGESRPAAVQEVAQHSAALLATLQAALEPGQPAVAPCRWLAAGLLTCLLYEPPTRGDGTAAAAADLVRRLLASAAAARVLQGLLAALQPAVAAASPQAARAAALAVANLAAYRGAAVAQAGGPLAGSGGSGDFAAWLAGKAAKLGHHGSGARRQEEAQQAQPPAPPPAPRDPRGALLHHGAMQVLLSLVAQSSAAIAAADAAARAPGGATAFAALTPDSRKQSTAAAASAAEDAALQRTVLSAALLAISNLCADPAAAGALRACARGTAGLHQQLQPGLTAAMSDRGLAETTRSHARVVLHTLSGAPGQRQLPVCTVLPPPRPGQVYPTP